MIKLSNVYIVQEPMRRDPITGIMVPSMDFRKAAEYGKPIVCVQTGRVAFTPGPTIQVLKDALKTFCDDDYFIPAGDPSLIAMAAIIAANNNMGRMKLLKWDKELKSYIEVALNIYGRKEQHNEFNATIHE